jgi:hypothetical protein
MKILDFFLFLWVIFALLDPDPDPATKINADPCGSWPFLLENNDNDRSNIKHFWEMPEDTINFVIHSLKVYLAVKTAARCIQSADKPGSRPVARLCRPRRRPQSQPAGAGSSEIR